MPDTIPRLMLEQARRLQHKTALRAKDGGEYHDISWEEVKERTTLFGRGLIALGLEPGERVAIMAPNCPEWVYADLGAMAAGCISVPVYHTEGIDTVLHIVKDSGARVLFIHSPLIARDLAAHLSEMPQLEKVILLEGDNGGDHAVPLDGFLKGAEATPPSALDKLLAAGDGAAVATLIYTSGTTGPPKGAILTHDNILSNIRASLQLFDIGEKDSCLSFLPLSHIFERMAGYYLMLLQGTIVAYAENFDTVPANLIETSPTIAISVPRLYEKMYARIMERVASGSWLKRQLFFTALKTCRAFVAKELAGERPDASLSLLTRLFRKLVFAKLKAPLGGRLRFFISGGAPLAPEIAEFFLAAGIPIYEGYGLTETAPVIAANCHGAQRLGTVGRAIPGTEVRIAEDGEILAKGPGVFQGYWEKADVSKEVFTDDGWFKTGDIGELDDAGFLKITDRKKDLIVTAGGKNIAPQDLESLFKTDKFITGAMIYGDRKPYLTALLVPNFDTLESYARIKKFAFLNHCDLVTHPKVLDLMRRRIDRLQKDLPPYRHIKRFTLISRDFAKEEGELTPTLKVKRNVVSDHFRQVLEGMYLARDHGIHDQGFCVVEKTQSD